MIKEFWNTSLTKKGKIAAVAIGAMLFLVLIFMGINVSGYEIGARLND